MTSLAKGASTNKVSIYVEWTALTAPDTGNSDIISYNLVWDAGSTVTNQDLIGLTTDYTGTTFVIT